MKTLPADAENLKTSRESLRESLRTPTPTLPDRLEFVSGFQVEIVTHAPYIVLPDGRKFALSSRGGQERTEIEDRNAIGSAMVTAYNALAADKTKIKALVEASSRIIGLIETGYLIPATDGNGRTDHAVSNIRAALALATA